MNERLPNDSDGDALRSLIEHGSDLSKEMEIDFAVNVPDRESGIAFASVVEPLGFRTNVSLFEPLQKWTCTCTLVMVPSYQALNRVEEILRELGRAHNAVPDGWGSFGNADCVS